jgi:hypothetical protein
VSWRRLELTGQRERNRPFDDFDRLWLCRSEHSGLRYPVVIIIRQYRADWLQWESHGGAGTKTTSTHADHPEEKSGLYAHHDFGSNSFDQLKA